MLEYYNAIFVASTMRVYNTIMKRIMKQIGSDIQYLMMVANNVIVNKIVFKQRYT